MRTSLPQSVRDAVACCSRIFTFFLPFIAALTISANTQGQSVQPDLVKVCSITEFSESANGHALWLANVPGISDSKYEFFPGAPGTLELFSDGTARIRGRVRNKTDQTLVWDIDFHYTGGSDWTSWSAGGGDYKDEANLAGTNYLDWDFFIFDASETNTLTGVDGLAGSSLTVTHNPANFQYGLQIGTAANSKNSNEGASVWFFINGTVLGNSIVNGHGDLNLNTGCSEVLTNCPIEQYNANDHILALPGVAADNDWIPAPFGMYFVELPGGEARLYGEIQNQDDPSLVLCVDYWFSNKTDFATWTGLGRNIKGNPSNINGNEVNWDFYIFNPNKVSSLSGCSPSTLGSYITVTHMPADYNFGLQVGLGANDKNAEFGLSVWFFTNGTFQGNAVSSHGDVNAINLCAPPPEIICFDNPPVITCPSDTIVDCLADTAPDFLGEATSDRPNSDCPAEVAIFFEDAINVNGCETVITRTWTVVDEYENIVSCDQLITVQDFLAPIISGVPEATTVDCMDNIPPAFDGVSATDNCDENVTLTIFDGACQMSSEDGCIGMRTQTPGGWGAPAAGNNPGVYRDANFSSAFPNGLTIGCDNSLTLTSAAAVQTFLPSGGPAAMLAAGNSVDPVGIENVFAGHLVALTLSVGFDNFDPNFGAADFYLADAVITSGSLQGMTVQEVLIEANNLIGGCGSSYTISDLTETLTMINENFVDGATLGVEVQCPGLLIENDCTMFVCRIWTATDDCGNASTGVQVITIMDDEAPVITCPADATVSCTDDTSPTALGMATATDNCGGDLTVEFSDSEVSGSCPEVFTRTWTATDVCGNTTSCDQVITILDTDAPVFDPFEAELTADCTENPEFSDLTASDECSTATVECFEGFQSISTSGPCTPFDMDRPAEAGPRSGWFPNMPGTSGSGSKLFTLEDGTYERFDDGTAHFYGTIASIGDDQLAWDFSIWLRGGYDWTEWSALGRDYKDEGIAGTNYLDWTYYEMDDTKPNVMVGIRDYSGSYLSLIHHPASYYHGFQVGQNANVFTETFGISGWMKYSGSILYEGETYNRSGQQCDFNLNLNCGPELINVCETVLVNTCIATDECGNFSIAQQSITITDETAPVITCPADVVVTCNSDTSPAITGEATAVDDCNDVVISFEDGELTGDGCTDTIVRTWTATDACGNSSSCDQTITVVDEEAPVAPAAPADVTVSCEEEIPAAAVLTADDACQGVITGVLSEEVTPGACANEQTILRTWTFDDGCGNVSSVSSTVNVIDETAPVFDVACEFDFEFFTSQGVDCPADAGFSFQEGDEFPVDSSYSIAGVSIPSLLGCVTDNCTANEDIVIRAALITEVGDGCSTTFTVDFEALDECGNVGSGFSCNYTITDDVAPELEMPADLDGDITCSDISLEAATGFANGTLTPEEEAAFLDAAAALFVTNGLVPVGTSDDCNGSDWEEISIGVELGDSCDALATLICTFVAVDDCGNVSESASTSLNIIDNTAPVITCPADVEVDCTADNSPAATGMATATDDCGQEVAVTYEDSGLSGDGCVNTFTRTWTATDACGNSSSCAQVITITDTTAPELIMPDVLEGDITCSDISLDDATGFANNTLTQEERQAFLQAARALFVSNGLIPLGTEDDCNPSDWEEVAIDVILSDSCDALATLICTFVAADDCGNVSEEIASELNIIDNTAPVISCPENTTVSCDEDSSPAATGMATATDDCGGLVDITFADAVTGDGCTDTIVRTWTATDACGNSSSCDQTITVVDEEAPVAPAAPADVTVSCEEEIPAAAVLTADDACQGVITGVLSEEVTPGACANEQTILRTWTFDDGCGNVSSVSSTVNVIDETAPVFDVACEFDFEFFTSQGVDCPADAGFSFQEGDEFPVDSSYSIAGVSIPSLLGCVTDNCTANEDIVIRAALITEVGDGCSTTFTVDFEALDECGNVGSGFSCNYTITDDVAPELEMPADLDGDITCSDISLEAATGFANGTLTPEEEAAFLDAAAALFVTNGLVPVGTSDDCNGSDWEEISIGVELGDSCDALATLICTFVAVDDCGNVSESASTSLNIIDNTAPVITCPADVEVDCTADNSPAATGMATATDDCGQEVAVTYEDSGLSGDGCVNTFTRTWTATDACGNSSSCAQVITITDTTAPELIMPDVLEGDITCSDISLDDATGFANNTLTQEERQAFLQAARALFVSNGLIPLGTEDDCNPSDWEEVAIDVILSDSCDALATLICTFVAADDCGNVSEEIASELNIIDNTAPVISCPENTTVSCDEDSSPAATGMATATDDCGGLVDITFADAVTGDGCTDTIVRTWTATDACGNSSSCDQTITVVDEEAPVAPAAPADVTVSCEEEIPAAAVLTADDACQGVITGVLSEEVTPGACANEQTILRTWTFDDGCGNVSSVSSTVNVIDETAPVFDVACEFDFEFFTSQGVDCPADAGFSFQEGDEFPVDSSYSIAGVSIPSLLGCVTDNCTANEDIVIRAALITEVGDGCSTTFTVDFEALDECGNVGSGFSCNYTITDDVAPELEMPADLDGDITCSDISLEAATGFANGTLTPEEEAAFLDAAAALFVTNGLVPVGTSDDCNGSDWEEISIGVELGDSCDALATLICTFVAVDDCGNVSESASTSLNIIDNTAPVITCPADVEVDCTADNSPAATGMATATDDCGQEVAVTYEDSGLSGDGCVNTFTRTWTATDACGNSSSCAQVITITDTTAPELIMPEETSMHITCMAVDYAMLLDYVDGNLSATQMSVYQSFLAGIFMQNGLTPLGAEDDCNDASFSEIGIEISTDVECPAKASVKCIFIAEDACGNLSEELYTELVVVDNTTPHIFCPADIVVTCGSDTSPDATGFATATDNCVGVMDIVYEDIQVSSSCPSSFIRIWTATDDCGNIATCEQFITTVEEDDCVSAPSGLEAEVVGSNSIHFSWNPVPNSIGCRVFARPAGSNASFTLGTVLGTEPSELTFTSNLLQNGLSIEWRVLCACDLSPLNTTPFSSWTGFQFLDDDNKNYVASNNDGDQLNGEIYPNPTRSTVFVNSEFKEGETLTVMDLSGKVVGQYNVPAATGLFEINLQELEGGVYFIQHSGLDGRSQTFKVVKNN